MTWNQKYPPIHSLSFHYITISTLTSFSHQLKLYRVSFIAIAIPFGAPNLFHSPLHNTQMATSSAMQSILVSPVTTGVAKGLGSSRMTPRCYMPRQQRNSSVVVRCTAEDGQKVEVGPVATPSPSSPPPSKAKVSTDFFDVLAFSGPAPERINGRLAMTGFVTAIAVELFKGEDVFAQISDGGIPWFLYTTVLLSVASLVPLFSGVTVESKSKGFMSSDAELWNGRVAMLGLVGLALTEYVKGGALV